MVSTKSNNKKVSVSFTNWVLGGSLVSVTSTDSERRHRRVSGRKVVISDVDSNDDEAVVKKIDNPKIEKKSKRKESEGDEKKDPKRKDGEGEKYISKEKRMCKKCGKDKGSGEKTGKMDDGDGDQQAESKEYNKSKEKSDKSGGQSGGKESSWTEEQDNKLREMKAAGNTWIEISHEVGHNKKDCQHRFKGLQKWSGDKSASKGDEQKADNSGATFSWNDGEAAETRRGGENTNWNEGAADSGDAGQSNVWGSGGATDAVGMDFGGLFDEPAKEHEKSNDTDANNWSVPPAEPGASNDISTNNWNKWGKKKDTEVHWEGGSEWKSDIADQHLNSGGSGWHKNGSNNQKQSMPNRWNDIESSQQSKQPEHQPGDLWHLQPDHIWSKQDCEILEYVYQRYKMDKWLHVRAKFFNYTQRMVSEEMIEKKFRDDGLA